MVYDPQDPMKDLYDVDDGQEITSLWDLALTGITENTVITVADWYHNVSTEQQIPA